MNLEKIFLIEMVKKFIFLGGRSKQNGLFALKCATKNVLMPPMFRIGLVMEIMLLGLVIMCIHGYFTNETLKHSSRVGDVDTERCRR